MHVGYARRQREGTEYVRKYKNKKWPRKVRLLEIKEARRRAGGYLRKTNLCSIIKSQVLAIMDEEDDSSSDLGYVVGASIAGFLPLLVMILLSTLAGFHHWLKCSSKSRALGATTYLFIVDRNIKRGMHASKRL